MLRLLMGTTLGDVPEIDELFPPRPPPVHISSEDSFFKAPPISSSPGFFTPDNGNNGNLFWPGQQIPFRIGPSGPRDSM